MKTPVALAKQLGTVVLRRRAARQAALRLARTCDRSLVLVYHRVALEAPGPHEVVPSLPAALFAAQLDMLQRMGRVVPLERLLEPRASQHGPRFAITFDDDHVSHRVHALPLLQARGMHATFFLSGRCLHGLGPYWWNILEHSIQVKGFEPTRRLLALDGSTPVELAAALENSRLTERLSQLLPCSDDPPMPTSDINALVGAGMTVGFHTLRHPIMTDLPRAALDAALLEGRSTLAAAAGTPVDLFAYPHGRANASVAGAVERTGFRAAFASGGRPISRDSDRFLLGRWDPGFLTGDDFAAAVALRLLRSPTPPTRHRDAAQGHPTQDDPERSR
ncbi:MAG: polysaccharide deacetylase family protein [Vicinamibacteraceae bacterium]